MHDERANVVPLNPENAPTAFISCKTAEDLLALTPEDAAVPIVIFGDEALRQYRSEEQAARFRKRGIRNPLIYYAPSRTISTGERVQFLDAGGDGIVDRDDMGSQGNNMVLYALARALARTARARIESAKVERYEYGIVHDHRLKSFTVNGAPLDLTRYEYFVLAAFFEVRGKTGTTASIGLIESAAYTDRAREKGSNSPVVLISRINKQLALHGIRIRSKHKDGEYSLEKEGE